MQTDTLPAVPSTALFGAVGPCSDPVQRVHRLYMVNTSASNVRGQLRILADMSRDNGVPDWHCDRLEKLADALVTVADLESPNVVITNKGSQDER
jgi:hypothetical protein